MGKYTTKPVLTIYGKNTKFTYSYELTGRLAYSYNPSVREA